MSKFVVVLAGICMVLPLLGGCRGGQGQKKDSWTSLPPPPPPPAVPPAVPTPLNEGLRGLAQQEIRNAVASTDPRVRANAIEAAQDTFGPEAQAIVTVALNDKEPIVRFAGAMAAGKLKLTDLHDRLLDLADDPSDMVKVGVRYALHRMGDKNRSQELVSMAQSPNVQVRDTVAMVFGLLNEPSAMKILRRMKSDTDADVRIHAAEAMWRMGDEQALEILVAGTVSQFPDDQMLCIMAIAGPRDRRVAGNLVGKLTDPYEEVSLVAARELGELGLDDGYGVAMKHIASRDARKRFLAAMAFGAIGRTDAQARLAPLLKDPDPRVRLAGATAVLRLKPQG